MTKPFDALVDNLSQLKGQYVAIEAALVSINKELKIKPLEAPPHIWALPKAKDMANLRARVDCLLKENGELKTSVATKDE